MHKYVILANPGHNRIYFEAALSIAHSEITAMLAGLNIHVETSLDSDIGLPAALAFSTTEALSLEAQSRLTGASIYYALFEVVEGDLLRPLSPEPTHTFPQSMSQILRYTGKTNEQFTRLMINLAVSAAQTNSEQITLLDPMCGKGTTLYEGLIQGLNVVGVEINPKSVHEIQTFIVKFMKNGRFKHKTQKLKQSAKGKKVADGFLLEAASKKEAFNAGDTQQLRLYAADTRIADQVLKKNSCDVMVSDLPYGVQHGSKSTKDVKMARSPLELVDDSLHAWKAVLKPKGAIVLSFNEFTLKWRSLAQVFENHGFKVLSEAPYSGYLHKVDSSINRNILVAVKP
jgi:tRNA G10  N-methylase Trm11